MTSPSMSRMSSSASGLGHWLVNSAKSPAGCARGLGPLGAALGRHRFRPRHRPLPRPAPPPGCRSRPRWPRRRRRWPARSRSCSAPCRCPRRLPPREPDSSSRAGTSKSVSKMSFSPDSDLSSARRRLSPLESSRVSSNSLSESISRRIQVQAQLEFAVRNRTAIRPAWRVTAWTAWGRFGVQRSARTRSRRCRRALLQRNAAVGGLAQVMPLTLALEGLSSASVTSSPPAPPA